MLALLATGVGLFWWVTARKTATVAYDVLTQEESPFGTDLGVPAVLLSIFGFFIAPATIGALAAVAYAATSEISAHAMARRQEDRKEDVERAKKAPPSPTAATRVTTGGSYVHKSASRKRSDDRRSRPGSKE